MSDDAEQIGLTWSQKMAARHLSCNAIVTVFLFFRNIFVQGVSLSGLKDDPFD